MDDFKFLEIIELLPGYVSAISLDLRYIAVNPGLKEFASEKTLNGQVIDCEVGCEGLPQRMKVLINAPVGTEDKWIYRQERQLQKQSLMVVSKRYSNFILNVATDITEVRSNEERLYNILSSLPQALDIGKSKRMDGAYQEFKELISSLNPNLEGEKPKDSALVEIEVLSKQALAKYSQLERDIFIEKDSLAARLNKLEVDQANDDEAWTKLRENKEQIQKLASLAIFLNSAPGGKKTLFLALILIQLLSGVVADGVIRYFGISKFLPDEIKELIIPNNTGKTAIP